MPERLTRLNPLRAILAAAASALLFAAPVSAQTSRYGDIEIKAEDPPGSDSLHGYTEHRITVRNASTEATYRVRVTMPSDNFRGGGGLVGVSREVEVRPLATRNLSLLQPAEPDIAGGNAVVHINGRRMEGDMPLRPTGSRLTRGYSHRGRGRGMRFAMVKSSSSGSQASVLVSTGVGKDAFKNAPLFLDEHNEGHGVPPKEKEVRPGRPDPIIPGGGAPRPPVMGRAMGLGTEHLIDAQFYQAAHPVSQWGADWLGYTRYDGVVISREEFDELRKGAGQNLRDILRALWQYTEAGGNLVVVDGKRVNPAGPRAAISFETTGKLEVPDAYAPTRVVERGMVGYTVGFGRAFLTPNRTPASWNSSTVGALQSNIRQTVTPWTGSRSLIELHRSFPVVDDLGVPVRGLFALMVVFSVAIGPANLWFLTRRNRRIWLLWTVPALSAAFCFMVLGYMVVAEGWSGHSRVAGLTILDETAQRATTLGASAVYSPLTPSGGLKFGMDTEVSVQGDEHSAYSSSCVLNWNDDDGIQHLARGYVTARVPSYFTLRKSQSRSERVNLRRETDGGLSARNGLGVDIKSLTVADEKGAVYAGSDLAAGQWARLAPAGETVTAVGWAEKVRTLYHQSSDWAGLVQRVGSAPKNYLAPNTYVAVVGESVFLEQPFKGAVVRPSDSVVLGLSAK